MALSCSTTLKICLVFLLLANICNVIAFATMGWSRIDFFNTWKGLWRWCTGDLCGDRDGDDYFKAVQWTFMIGSGGFAVTLVILFLYSCMSPLRKRPVASVWIFLCFISGVFSLIGVAIYGARKPDIEELHYSYGLACCGLILGVLTGVFGIADSRA
ncbi:uncharacterized protein LOC106173471 [Lingula anatina]|uniref:Uncharacterized protein LOC106160679 n=1 Tax=Lingula anatina TaxID=7574 RepID=A0A1S3JJI4_LINAN|nr:uncharacterized protein LOC106160679 [Lingula anatina]XP_013410064.1 uncharacterized protein LOC106173471 [Lingula anatina]|eukprot:XP_013392797.1 uncharacterized protein LOC106160679 [Lingula anatina]